MTRTLLMRAGRWLVAFATIFFLTKRLYNLLTELDVKAVALESPLCFIGSLILLFFYYSGLGIPWLFLYRAGSGKRVSVLSGWTFFQLSQLGRYLPGKIGQYVLMFSLSKRFQIKKKHAVLSTSLQLIFQCCLGCIVALPALRTSSILQNLLKNFQMSPKTIFLSGIIVMLVLGAGLLLLYEQYNGIRLLHLIKQSFYRMLSVSEVLCLIGSYLLLWGLLGLAFFLFTKSLYLVLTSQLLMITSTYALAWSIGFLCIITPNGLGIREGILNLLLTIIMPPATATLVALLARLWTLSAELFLGGVVFGLYVRQRHI